MINILFTNFNSKIPEQTWNHSLMKLPADIQNRICRYVRWQDRQAGILGKILLLEGLREYGYDAFSLNNLSYNQFGRPFLDSSIDFNISHSGSYVILAISNNGRVGIDIEKISDIDLSDFKRYMRSKEWENIKNSKNSYEKFYEYWTMKESLIKGDGRGLSISLTDIYLEKKRAILDKSRWFLHEIILEPAYKSFLATDLEEPEIKVREFEIR